MTVHRDEGPYGIRQDVEAARPLEEPSSPRRGLKKRHLEGIPAATGVARPRLYNPLRSREILYRLTFSPETVLSETVRD